jgi:hypothetical protein
LNDNGNYQNRYRYCYRAFGLTIGSGMEIPELLPADGEPDVVIQRGSVPETLENPKMKGVRFQAKPGEFLLTVDSVARFRVLTGNRIIIDGYPGIDEKDIRLFLLGSAVGALLHQRGMLPLHASAVKVDDRCVVFCGASGNGKSTTARALVKRGYRFHSDDLCVISVNHTVDGNVPVVFPGYPQLKLWEDALKKMGDDTSGYSRVRRVLDKYAVPAKDFYNTQPLPIKKIYILRPWEKEEIEMVAVTGMEKFNVLKNQTYRFQFLEGLKKEVSHFKSAGIVGNCAPISRVRRPQDISWLDRLLDLLETDFLK